MLDDDDLTTLALLGAGGAFAGAALASRATPITQTTPRVPFALTGLHVVPVPMFGTYAPAISNEYKPNADHLGVDFMYPRANRGDQLAMYPLHTPNGARDYFMPDGTLALAAADGVVRFADWTVRGWTLIIDHADGASTYYTHLESLSVTRTASARGVQRVIAGQPLGVISFDPLDAEKLKHLHFELWLGRSRDRAANPGPFVAQWPRVRLIARGNGTPDIQLVPR